MLASWFTGCAASRPNTPQDKLPLIAVVPFRDLRDDKTAYFGESCRRNFMDFFGPDLRRKANITTPESVHQALQELYDRDDPILYDGDAVNVAQKLHADAIIMGICRPKKIGVYLLEGKTGKIIWGISAPVRYDRERAFRALSKLARQKWPCVGYTPDGIAALTGEVAPKTIAVLPVVNDTTDLRADEIVRKLCHDTLKSKGLTAIEITAVDERLRQDFGITVGGQLRSASVADIAKALGVEAVALLRVKQFGGVNIGFVQERIVEIELSIVKPADSKAWVATGIGGGRKITIDPKEALLNFVAGTTAKFFEGAANVPLKPEIGVAFNTIWQQMPLWLQ
jgi:hypothetical protein